QIIEPVIDGFLEKFKRLFLSLRLLSECIFHLFGHPSCKTQERIEHYIRLIQKHECAVHDAVKASFLHFDHPLRRVHLLLHNIVSPLVVWARAWKKFTECIGMKPDKNISPGISRVSKIMRMIVKTMGPEVFSKVFRHIKVETVICCC